MLCWTLGAIHGRWADVGCHPPTRVGQLECLSEKHKGLMRVPYGEEMMIAFTPGDGSLDQAKRLMGILYDLGLLSFLCGASPVRL